MDNSIIINGCISTYKRLDGEVWKTDMLFHPQHDKNKAYMHGLGFTDECLAIL
jgi:hypothetical protein